jgi:hypothetical protein
VPLVRCRGFSRRIIEQPALLDGQTVYAILDQAAGAVKVGTCRGHPCLRLAALQTGNPRRLQLLGYTVALTEAEAHRRLRKHRIRGEWHRPARAVLQEINTWDFLDETLYQKLIAQCC